MIFTETTSITDTANSSLAPQLIGEKYALYWFSYFFFFKAFKLIIALLEGSIWSCLCLSHVNLVCWAGNTYVVQRQQALSRKNTQVKADPSASPPLPGILIPKDDFKQKVYWLLCQWDLQSEKCSWDFSKLLTMCSVLFSEIFYNFPSSNYSEWGREKNWVNPLHSHWSIRCQWIFSYHFTPGQTIQYHSRSCPLLLYSRGQFIAT